MCIYIYIYIYIHTYVYIHNLRVVAVRADVPVAPNMYITKL